MSTKITKIAERSRNQNDFGKAWKPCGTEWEKEISKKQGFKKFITR